MIPLHTMTINAASVVQFLCPARGQVLFKKSGLITEITQTVTNPKLQNGRSFQNLLNAEHKIAMRGSPLPGPVTTMRPGAPKWFTNVTFVALFSQTNNHFHVIEITIV